MINDAREGWSDFLLISINKLIFISCKELLILIYKIYEIYEIYEIINILIITVV